MTDPLNNEPERPELFQARIETAKRAHDDASKADLAMLPSVISFAAEALKAAALVNGGSAAAMLAFIGTGRQPVTTDTILALKLFGFGLLAAAIATGTSYFAQFCYHSSFQLRTYEWHPPFVRNTRRGRAFMAAGAVFHIISVLLVLAAYAGAVYGLLSIAGTLVPKAAKA